MRLCDTVDAVKWVRHLIEHNMNQAAIAEAATVSPRVVSSLAADEYPLTDCNTLKRLLRVKLPDWSTDRERARVCIAFLKAYGYTTGEISQDILGRKRDTVKDLIVSERPFIAFNTLALLELAVRDAITRTTADYQIDH